MASWMCYDTVRCIKCDELLPLCCSTGRILMKICFRCGYICHTEGKKHTYSPVPLTYHDDTVPFVYTLNEDGTIKDIQVREKRNV
jgi:hypothetical protein